jgi:predicted ribosome quality control (RQC) complex YloA/Tae2 family protein
MDFKQLKELARQDGQLMDLAQEIVTAIYAEKVDSIFSKKKSPVLKKIGPAIKKFRKKIETLDKKIHQLSNADLYEKIIQPLHTEFVTQ